MCHLANPVSELTIDQLSAIFTGQIDNWKELGGNDAPIILLSRETNSGTHVYFLEEVVRQGDSGSKAIFAPQTLLMPSSVGITSEIRRNPNAIGYDGLGYVDPAHEKLIAVAADAGSPYVMPTVATGMDGSYPIARPLYMYTAGQPSDAVAEYLAWIQGRKPSRSRSWALCRLSPLKALRTVYVCHVCNHSRKSRSIWSMLKTEQAASLPAAQAETTPSRRHSGEWWIEQIIRGAGLSTIFIIGLIFLFLLREGLPAFVRISPLNLLGVRWYPIEELYGLLPLLVGSLLVTVGAVVIAVPLGLITAIYLGEIAPLWQRELLKPLIEVLAGIPSIVLGFLGWVALAPLVQQAGAPTGLTAFTGA